MEGTISLHTRDLNPDAIKAIQERFGDAQLEISINSDGFTGEEVLSDSEFWALIEQLDWEAEPPNKVVSNLVEALSELPIGNIYQFADKLARCLWQLDTYRHAKGFLEDGEYLSVDGFLYARCAVVANGQEVYDEILNSPDEMPLDLSFEELLYTAEAAYLKKTGEEMVYRPLFNYETYSNKEGWDNSIDA